MGIYYSAISKRTKTIDGIKVAFKNFYGKRPIMWYNDTPNREWNSFCTRAESTAKEMKDVVKYVMSAKDVSVITKCGYVPIAKWDGDIFLHDGFWDDKTVGIVYKSGRSLKIAFGDDAKEIMKRINEKSYV